MSAYRKLVVALLSAQQFITTSTPLASAQNSLAGRGLLRERLRQNLGTPGFSTRGGSTDYKIAGLEVAAWEPSTEGKAPLVIFSHGFGGSNMQSSFLMKALRQEGYLVLAPNHQDAHGAGQTNHKPQQNFAKARQWSDKTHIDRHDDIVNLLAALHSDPKWNDRIDWSKVALCGHSLGGYTVLGMVGAWPSWKIGGIKAVLALSPYVTPYNENGALDKMSVPVMYQGGTRDFGITPFVKPPGGAFSKTSSPAYFVDFEEFGHFTWTDFNQNKEKQDAIVYYCVAFLDKYLRNSHDDRLSRRLPGVVDLEAK